MKLPNKVVVGGFVLWAVIVCPAFAYQYVGGSQNCQQCHTDYTSGSDWHNMHTNLAKDDCTKCHNEQQLVPTANCKTCHSGLPCKWVNNHNARGTQTCITCHAQCQSEEENCPTSTCLGTTSPQLETLRQFRDKVLATTATGRALIRAYYAAGSKINEYLEANPRLKATAKQMLELIAACIEPFIRR
ncbi:MAG: cytochrome c family protein [Desulfobacterota bacterium]|nr:cytochrome c family protein [Thermodesulfobacteriota bacterium]